jgi:hypothetical protein
MHADLTRGDADVADFGKQTELDAYAHVAHSLLDTFAQWNLWQSSAAVHEGELCRAMHGGEQRFYAYCRALPLAQLSANRVDVEAATARAHVQRSWWQMQLAAMYEVGNTRYSTQRAAVCAEWQPRLWSARQAKPRNEPALAGVLRQKEQALAAMREPLDELLPAVPDARDVAAAKGRQLARDQLGHSWRCGRKLVHLVRRYGTGLLLLEAPVMRVKRLYRLPDDEYAVLLVLLRHCSRFRHFTHAVSGAYEVTCAQHANSEQQPLERLRDFVHQHNNAVLQRASAAGTATLYALGW